MGRIAPETYQRVNHVAISRVAAELSLTPAKKAGKGYFGCIACKSSDALHARPKGGGFTCFSCGGGWSNVDAAAVVWGVPAPDACARLAERFGIEIVEAKRTSGRGDPVAIYDYVDEHGSLLHQTLRYANPKGFGQRAPDGNGGWKRKPEGGYTLAGVRTVLYHLPQLIEAIALERPVYLVEGEKDADAAAQLGLTATTCPMGAKHWRAEYAAMLEDADVIIIPDNDEPGKAHALAVAEAIAATVRRLRLVELPGVPDRGDLSDWLAQGGTRQALEALVARAPDYGVPPAKSARELEAGEDALPEPICALHPPPIEPITWEVENLITRGEPALIVGAGGARKTSTMLQIVLAIAGGYPALGAYGTTRGPVLIVSEEEPYSVLSNRMDAFIRGHNWDRALVLGNVHVLAQKGVRLPSDLWQRHLTELVTRIRPRVVLFDPWHEIRDGREDSADDAKLAVRAVKEICAPAGATPIILHHINKPSEGRGPMDRVRGSSHLVNAMRTAYFLEERDEQSTTVTCPKLSRAEKPKPFVVHYTIESSPTNRAEWYSARVECQTEKLAAANRTETWLLQQLDEWPGVTGPTSTNLKDAAKPVAGISGEDVSLALARLEAIRLITFDAGPRGAKHWKRSTLPDAAGKVEEMTLPTLPQVAGQGQSPPSQTLPAPVGGKARLKRERAASGKVEQMPARHELSAKEEQAYLAALDPNPSTNGYQEGAKEAQGNGCKAGDERVDAGSLDRDPVGMLYGTLR